jgi:hypothetical protein
MKPRRGQKRGQFNRHSLKHKAWEMQVQTVERETWEKVSKATEIEN